MTLSIVSFENTPPPPPRRGGDVNKFGWWVRTFTRPEVWKNTIQRNDWASYEGKKVFLGNRSILLLAPEIQAPCPQTLVRNGAPPPCERASFCLYLQLPNRTPEELGFAFYVILIAIMMCAKMGTSHLASLEVWGIGDQGWWKLVTLAQMAIFQGRPHQFEPFELEMTFYKSARKTSLFLVWRRTSSLDSVLPILISSKRYDPPNKVMPSP